MRINQTGPARAGPTKEPNMVRESLAFIALAATVAFWTWQVVEHLAR